MRAALLLLPLCLAASLTGFLAEAKGSAGGYRSYKDGYYSRSHLFMYGGIASRGYSGRTEGYADPASADVFCRRDVRIDDRTYVSDVVTLNSTRYCYRQVTTTDGAPENTAVLATWLDVYQWTLSAVPGAFPSIEMRQFDDKDFPTAVPASEWKVVLTRIFQGIEASVDPRNLTWKATRKAPADKSVWGYPASYTLDNARLTTFSIRGSGSFPDGEMNIVLTFSLASDFAEDALRDHVFLRPSALKIDVEIDSFPFNSAANTSLGLEMHIVLPSTTVSSVGRPVPSKWGTEYDPKLGHRLELGTAATAEARGRHHLSWRAHTHHRSLCVDGNDTAALHCARLATDCDPSGRCHPCVDPAAGICPELGIPAGHTAIKMSWSAVGSNRAMYPVQNSYLAKRTPFVTWTLFMGTFDTAEVIVQEPGAASVAGASPFLLALAVVVSLLL
ncbi:hypothetical protein DIPPA_32597 [Diplonema papillatum]|nr:hypothetical protein DIPPA_32597 [Diplonema papillatum]